MTNPNDPATQPWTSSDEIRLLRHALLDALIVFDVGEAGSTQFHKAYGEVIERAQLANIPKEPAP